MALLEWNDALYTGLPAADYEHRKLIDLANRRYEAWIREGKASPGKLFDDLLKLFATHFTIEERLMLEISFAERRSHEEHHRGLLVWLGDIREKAADPGYDPGPELGPRLQDWLRVHIREHDAPLYRVVDAGARPGGTGAGPGA